MNGPELQREKRKGFYRPRPIATKPVLAGAPFQARATTSAITSLSARHIGSVPVEYQRALSKVQRWEANHGRRRHENEKKDEINGG